MTTILAWLTLALPLLAAASITLLALRRRTVSAALSIGSSGLAFLASVLLFSRHPLTETAWVWLSLSDGVTSFVADIGLRLDPLSLLMLVVVTGVGAAIHIYSYGYLREDRSPGRYFAGLSLFMFSMTGVVLANNFLMMFVFWELVGVSSYLLIGFWYDRPAAADAGKKAFLTNRVGDFGFLLGIILVWFTLDSLHFGELERLLTEDPGAFGGLATLVGVLIFCGAVGKSAQFPLHVWLPDAMEGPTPVSALIHAATMVAAGVYMLCRVFFILALPESSALTLIAWVGGLTALLAALMALQQDDIKRILAYSTLSQLGYMVLAVGLSGREHGPTPAMYHLTTHAFFKALLFLGAGSVIHALRHEQNIWRMGGLHRKMPITFLTFLVGALALCGIPPLSGFFSKDAILALALEAHRVPLFILALFVALLTPLYVFRLVLVAFTGPAKSQAPDQARESGAVMVFPMLLLAVPALLAGFWGIDLHFDLQFAAGEPAEAAGWGRQLLAPFLHAPLAAGSGLAVALAGMAMAFALYRNRVEDPLPGLIDGLARWMQDRFYFDELYHKLIGLTQEKLADLAEWFDRWVIAGVFVRGTHGTVELCGRLLRLVQTGNLQTYSFLFAAGVVALLWFALAW